MRIFIWSSCHCWCFYGNGDEYDSYHGDEYDSYHGDADGVFFLQELVNQFRRPEPCAVERLHLLYCVQLPPLWIVQVMCRQLYIIFTGVYTIVHYFHC